MSTKHIHLPVLTVLVATSCSANTGADREVQEPAPPPPETGETQTVTPAPEEAVVPPPESAPESPPENPPPPDPGPAPGPKPVPVAPAPPPPGAEIVWGKKFVPNKNSELPAKWTTCKKNDDCVVMDVDCCDHASVNQKHAKKAREKLPHTMCDMECGMESVRGVCMKGKCGVQLGKHPGMDYD